MKNSNKSENVINLTGLLGDQTTSHLLIFCSNTIMKEMCKYNIKYQCYFSIIYILSYLYTVILYWIGHFIYFQF